MKLTSLKHLLLGSLRRQVMFGMVLTVALLMSLFVWDTTRRQQEVVATHQSEQALAIVRSMAVSGSGALAARDVAGLQEIVQGLSNYPDLRYAMVLDLQGLVLAHTEPARRGQYVSDLPTTTAPVLHTRASQLIDAIMPVQLNGRAIGWARAGLAGDSLQTRLDQVARSGMVYTALAVAVSIVVAALVAGLLTRRLSAIAQVVNQVHAGGSGLRVLVQGSDEAAQLGRQFNAMLDTLAERDQALKDSEAFKTTILDAVAGEVAVLDHDGVIVAVNAHWRRFAVENSQLTGQPAPRTCVGTNYLHVCAQADDHMDPSALQAREGIRAVLDGSLPDFSLGYPCHAPLQHRWFSMMVRPLSIAGKGGAVITHTDISAIKQAEHEELFRNQILELLSTNNDLPALLPVVIDGLEQLQLGVSCRIALLSEDGQSLQYSAAPSLPEQLRRTLDAAALSPSRDPCALASMSTERVIVPDITVHPDWAVYRAMAEQTGLRALWSQPILSSNNTVLGAISCFRHSAHTPGARELAVVAESARLLGLALEQKRIQDALVTSEDTFRTLFHTSPIGVLYQNKSGLIIAANPAAQRILGLTLAQLQGRTSMDPCWHAVHEDGTDFPGEQHPISVALKTGQPVRNVVMGIAVPERELVWILISAEPLFKNGQLVQAYVVFEDITERYQMQQQLRQLAFFDPLTQLPNRRLLTDRLSQALTTCKRSARYGAMMFLDLDNFKPLNDRHGHEVGDLLLIEVARRLKACVREVDTVARLGGDEFVVVLVDLHAQASESADFAKVVAEKIRASLAAPYVLTFKNAEGAGQVVEHHCSASIGLTLFSQYDSAHDPVFQRADEAMYQAKELGRNRVQFSQALV